MRHLVASRVPNALLCTQCVGLPCDTWWRPESPTRCCVRGCCAHLGMRPAGRVVEPMCTTPRRNVPVVTTTAAARTSSPERRDAPQGACLSASNKLRIEALGFGAGRQEMVLERGMNPKRPRRTCTRENGLHSWRGESAGVAKRRSPTGNPGNRYDSQLSHRCTQGQVPSLPDASTTPRTRCAAPASPAAPAA